MSTEVTTHDSVKVSIETAKQGETCWLGVKAFDKEGKCLIEVTLFGKQELVLGDEYCARLRRELDDCRGEIR